MKHILLPLRTIDVLKEFTMSSESTQPELQSRINVSPPTAFRAVDQLRNLGILSNGEDVLSDARGRPSTSLKLNPQGMCVFALVIRTDLSFLYLVDALGQIHEAITIPVGADEPYDSAIERFAAEIISLLEAAQTQFYTTAGVGIAFAGWVDPAAGRLTAPSRFPGWRQKPIAQDLSDRTGLTCSVDNDAISLAQAAVWFSPQQSLQSFALLHIDFGLGASYCFDGKVYRGNQHISAGLAHTNLTGWSTERCHCGRTGCLETVLSIPAILKSQNQSAALSDRVNMISRLRSLESEARSGDPSARQILEEAGRRTALIGANISQALDLPAVVFSGGMVENSATFWEAIDQELARVTGAVQQQLYWWRLNVLLENDLPEALGATAVALASLYHSRSITLLNDGQAITS